MARVAALLTSATCMPRNGVCCLRGQTYRSLARKGNVVKTRSNVRNNSPAANDDKPRPSKGPLAGPGKTEATKPRDKRDEAQRGPGSANADLWMTGDGGTDIGNKDSK